MSIYVFDNNSLSNVFKFYYLKVQFPSLCENFDNLVREGRIISVDQVKDEMLKVKRESILAWVEKNKDLFPEPTHDETDFVREIYKVQHFQNQMKEKVTLSEKPFADPFVIAKAKVLNGTVVTEEKYKENSVSIPNVCEHFSIQCTDFQGFMEKENWRF